jgi:hypothetical protein
MPDQSKPQTVAEKQAAQRKSDALTRIVAVVYGVAITQALTRNPDIILHPRTPANQQAAIALAAAIILGSYGFFSYTLAVDGAFSYNISWPISTGQPWSNSKLIGAGRFALDLIVAGLYVQFLLAAASLGTVPPPTPLNHYTPQVPSNPSLRDLFMSLALAMAGVFVSRSIRYVRGGRKAKEEMKSRRPPGEATNVNLPYLTSSLPSLLLALVVGVAAWFIGMKQSTVHPASSPHNTRLLWVLLGAIFVYTILSHLCAYLYWSRVSSVALQDEKLPSRTAIYGWSDKNIDKVRVSLGWLGDLLGSQPWGESAVKEARNALACVAEKLKPQDTAGDDEQFEPTFQVKQARELSRSLEAVRERLDPLARPPSTAQPGVPENADGVG